MKVSVGNCSPPLLKEGHCLGETRAIAQERLATAAQWMMALRWEGLLQGKRVSKICLLAKSTRSCETSLSIDSSVFVTVGIFDCINKRVYYFSYMNFHETS